MTLVRGIHLLAHGSKIEARRVARDIQQNQRLLVGPNTVYGAGTYAWHADHIPENLMDWPQVLFEVDDRAIIDIYTGGEHRGFFVIPGAIGTYVSIHVVEFRNLW